jgi:hypothetical protein
LPLYRIEQIAARQGVPLARSTLAEWIGRIGVALRPLARPEYENSARPPQVGSVANVVSGFMVFSILLQETPRTERRQVFDRKIGQQRRQACGGTTAALSPFTALSTWKPRRPWGVG